MALLICASPGLCEEVRYYYYHFTYEESTGIVHSHTANIQQSRFEPRSI